MKRLFLVLLLMLPTVRPSGRPAASLTIGRLHYDGGGDWYANPSSLPNLLTALRQRTTLPVADRERVVTLTGPELWDVPYIYMTGQATCISRTWRSAISAAIWSKAVSCMPTTTTA